jgi:hypothetical protein
MASRASPRSLPGNSYKHLDNTSGEGSRDHISSAVTIKAFSRMSDQGFIGETEASSGGLSVRSREQTAVEGSELEKS